MVDLNGAQSVDRALEILSAVGRHAERGVGLGEIVLQCGLSKPTARRLLLALMRAKMIEQDADSRRYFLGEESYVLGSLASRRFGLLQLAMDSLLKLSRRTEDASFVSVRRGNHSVCLYRQEGTFPIRTYALQAGFEHPLGCGAGSLALLAAQPDEEVEAVIAANAGLLAGHYPMLTPQRIREDVAFTRERGYALNPGLIIANSWGLGVVVRHPDGRPAGALSLAAVESRMQEPRQSELAAMLVAEAAVVEQKVAQMFASRATPALADMAARGKTP